MNQHKVFVFLVSQAVATLVLQLPQPLRERIGKSLHIKVPVHLLAAALQAPSIFWPGLFPAMHRSALSQPMAKPGYSGLV